MMAVQLFPPPQLLEIIYKPLLPLLYLPTYHKNVNEIESVGV